MWISFFPFHRLFFCIENEGKCSSAGRRTWSTVGGYQNQRERSWQSETSDRWSETGCQRNQTRAETSRRKIHVCKLRWKNLCLTVFTFSKPNLLILEWYILSKYSVFSCTENEFLRIVVLRNIEIDPLQYTIPTRLCPTPLLNKSSKIKIVLVAP